MAIGQRVQPAAEVFKPLLIHARQRECEKKAARSCTAGGEVGKVDGERLVTQRFRVYIRKKVNPLYQRIGRHRPLLTGAGREQGTIVANAQCYDRAGRHRTLEKAVDQLELADKMSRRFGNQVRPVTSLVRSCAATLSSTPLTYRKPSVPPKLFASSTASLMTTR